MRKRIVTVLLGVFLVFAPFSTSLACIKQPPKVEKGSESKDKWKWKECDWNKTTKKKETECSWSKTWQKESSTWYYWYAYGFGYCGDFKLECKTGKDSKHKEKEHNKEEKEEKNEDNKDKNKEKPNPKPEDKPEPKPEDKPEPQPEDKPEPQPEDKPEPQPEDKPEPEVETEPEPEVEAEPEPEVEPKVKGEVLEPEVEAEPEPETKEEEKKEEKVVIDANNDTPGTGDFSQAKIGLYGLLLAVSTYLLTIVIRKKDELFLKNRS